MFIKIENNVVVEWPISSIYSRFPHTSFPVPLTDADLAPLGYATVVEAHVPDYDRVTHTAIPVTPTLIDGRWTQQWQIVDREPDEVLASQAGAARAKRDEMLRASDISVVADRWAAMTPVLQGAWAAYRQALRDVPSQSGFPHSIVWPVSPA